MRNLLSLDGGGIRGVFSLQVLARMEELLREHFNKPNLVLADYFDFIGGTSTGAIIAALLAWGRSVEDICNLYQRQSSIAFSKPAYWAAYRLRPKYYADKISGVLRDLFSEQTTDKTGKVFRVPAKLGTRNLKTLYLCVMRNALTGSSWLMTNCRNAKYNQRDHAENNLEIPLYQLVRASTAAPTYFPPEVIAAGTQEWLFIDGGITPYNNPSFLMYLVATLPCYGIGWPDGTEKIRLISVGNGRFRKRYSKAKAEAINNIHQIEHSIHGLIDSANVHQDLACRAIGECIFGEPIDTEVGDLMSKSHDPQARASQCRACDLSTHVGGRCGIGSLSGTGSHAKFLYCRYNHEFTPDEIKSLRQPHLEDMDRLELIPFWMRFGADYARKNVQLTHLV